MLTTLLLAVIPLVYLLLMLLLTAHKRNRHVPDAVHAETLADIALPAQGHARLLRPHRVQRLLRRALKLPEEQSAVSLLRAHQQTLTAGLLVLRRSFRDASLLPCLPNGEIRMLALARETLRHGTLNTAHMLQMLEAFQEQTAATLAERLALPLCLRVLLADHLQLTLRRLLACDREYRQGQKLAKRWAHQTKVIRLLERRPPSTACLAAMLKELRAVRAVPTLSQLDSWLAQRHRTAASVTRSWAQEQSRVSGMLTRIVEALRVLDQQDWPRLVEAADPLHQLLMNDPSGLYPRMDLPSRASCRESAAWLANHLGVEESEIVRTALELAGAKSPDMLEHHAVWYLLEPDGLRALRRAVKGHRAWLALEVRLRKPWLYRAGLWAFALGFSIFILARGYTLWLLPMLLPVTGLFGRALLRPLTRRPPLPRLALQRLDETMRILMVLPVTLRDRHDAIQAVKQLASARRSMPDSGVDCLLLGDWEENMTQHAGEDADTMLAASSALEALAGEDADTRWLYLQRTRQWSSRRRAFVAPEGRHGAIGDVCRLIASGKIDNEPDYATFELTELYKHYAWVMSLSPGVRLEPDTLLRLAGTMAHPLNTRIRTAHGARGISLLGVRMNVDPSGESTRLQRLLAQAPDPQPADSFPGIGLIRPDALLEGVDGWILPETLTSAAWLASELSGLATGDSAAFAAAPEDVQQCLTQSHEHARQIWQLAPWLLPYVKTPEGVRRNPLRLSSRFALRERFRWTLLPLCQLTALTVCTLHRDPWLLLLMLLAPAASFRLTFSDLRLLGASLVFLPAQAFLRLEAACRALWAAFFPKRRQVPLSSDKLTLIVLCAQAGISALLAGVSAWHAPLFVPGLLLAGCFACYPLVQQRLDASFSTVEALSESSASQLTDIAEATWRYFEKYASENLLPPEAVQTQPNLGASSTVTTEAAALTLLSCLAARELGLIDTERMTLEVSRLLEQLERLPRWNGLFFARYDRTSGQAENPALIPAAANGLMCACLITLAQGLRTFLPEIAEEYHILPARIDALASEMRLAALYDEHAELFYESVNPDCLSQPGAYLNLCSGEGLLLSFVAVTRREVPARHLSRLRRTQVRAGFLRPQLTRHGSASEALMHCLLLPALESVPLGRAARDAARLQTRYTLDGIFGVSGCACSAYDEQLRYLRRPFGLPETAEEGTAFAPVFAPYACALCLPFAPQAAAESLQQMRALGMFGHLGFLDAVDFIPAHAPESADFALVRLQDTAHQGLLLCALCNALTDGALRRCFTDIPAVDACMLLLLDRFSLSLPLPQRYPLVSRPPEPSFRRIAEPRVSPVDAHLIGSSQASVLIGAQGSGVIHLKGLDVTRFTARPWKIEGPQVYLRLDDRVWRLMDPALPGEVIFGEGLIRFTRIFDQLTAQVTLLIDPVAGAVVQSVEFASQTALDLTVELTDCLVPALSGRVTRPQEQTLTLPWRDMTLIHTLHTQEAPQALSVQTDLETFVGAGGLARPSSLERELSESLTGAYLSPCLSFRLRLTLPGHGRTTVMFATRLVSGAFTAYEPPELPGLTVLSRLASRTLTDSLPLRQEDAARLSLLTGALMWRGQAHQGAFEPLRLPFSSLESRGVHADKSILTVFLHSDEGESLLREALDTAGLLLLMGRSVTLCIVCQGEQSERTSAMAEEALHTALLHRHPEGSVFLLDNLTNDETAALRAVSRLVLVEGQGTADEQLLALQAPLAQDFPRFPDPGILPDQDSLLYDNGLSGFDPQTGDCLIHLSSEQTVPGHWRLPLTNGRCLTRVTWEGLGGTCAEQRLITGESAFVRDGEGTVFSVTPAPAGRILPWEIRFSPGVVSWRTRANEIETTLTAACLPRRAAGLRTLRLRNLSEEEKRLTVHLVASFAPTNGNAAAQIFLTPVSGGVTAQSPLADGTAFVMLAESGCLVRVLSDAESHGLYGLPPLPDAPGSTNGTSALLSMEAAIQAGGLASITWLAGYAQQADDIELLLSRVRRSGASAILRSVRQNWGLRVARLTFHTPEPALDLLLNRWLPWQFLNSQAPLALAAQAILEPGSVRPRLLLMARDHSADDLLPWLTARYVRLSGDEAALNDLVPRDSEHAHEARETLYARCLHALKVEPDGLPALLFRLEALNAFTPFADEPDQVDLMSLCAHWSDAARAGLHELQHEQIDAHTAAWAILGLGVSPTTADLLRDALSALYDPMHGFIAASSTPDTPQRTVDALWLILAAARFRWNDRVWELTRALNPIYHTDTPERTAEYRSEPYALAARVCTSAPHIGQASGALSAEAAALMYMLLVEELLGLDRQGPKLLLHPMVPDDWEDFSVTLREGASTWHVQFDQHASLSVDGVPSDEAVQLLDDSGVHEVRAPIGTRVTQS